MTDAVLALLQEKKIFFSISGKDYVTTCFNPEHIDTNPSFRIDKISGICHCFSCGYKTNIFKYFGILSNNTSIRVAKLKQKLTDLKTSINGLDMLQGAKPCSQSFRGISTQTLKEFGAFYTDKIEKLGDRIIFPITDVRDKIVCYVGRHTLSNGNPRYANYPSGVAIPMFPVKFKKQYTSMVIVEGIFDMLNLYDKGLHNVACTFGTSKLHADVSEKLFSYKVIGIEKIFIMYDGDDAGKVASAKIKPLIEEAGFIVEIIEIPDDTDPGEMSQDDVNMIIEYIK